jgi:uncharacterized membrane protein YdbT with pleckstrin-like domain
MATAAEHGSEAPDVSYLEPIYQYHEFYARLYLRGAVGTFLAAALCLLWFPWGVSAVLVAGGAVKTLLWVKHRRAKRSIEARSSAQLFLTDS